MGGRAQGAGAHSMMLWIIPSRTVQLDRMASVRKVKSSEQRTAECDASSCGRAGAQNRRVECLWGTIADGEIR